MHCLLILAKFQTLSLRKCDRSSVVESLSQMHFLRCKEQRNSKSYCIRFCTNYVVILHLPKKYNELKVQVDIAFSSSIRIALGVDITPVIRWVYHCQKQVSQKYKIVSFQQTKRLILNGYKNYLSMFQSFHIFIFDVTSKFIFDIKSYNKVKTTLELLVLLFYENK